MTPSRRTLAFAILALGLPAVHRAQAGLVADMDSVADVLYHRTSKAGKAA